MVGSVLYLAAADCMEEVEVVVQQGCSRIALVRLLGEPRPFFLVGSETAAYLLYYYS